MITPTSLTGISFFAFFYAYHYLSGKVESYKNKIEKGWCDKIARKQAEALIEMSEGKEGIEDSEDLKEHMEKFYSESFKKQLETADKLSQARKPSEWLNYAQICFLSSFVLFLTTTILSFSSSTQYTLPLLILGSIMIVIGLIYILKTVREI